MIRHMIKKALGLEARADDSQPNPAAPAHSAPAAGASDGLMQVGRKPQAAAPASDVLAPRPRDMEVGAWLDEVSAANPVLLFMKGTPSAPMCGFSARVSDILRQAGTPFLGYNILEDPSVREGIKAYNQWPTLPQVFIGGEFVGGCDIITEMAMSGELVEALNKLKA